MSLSRQQTLKTCNLWPETFCLVWSEAEVCLCVSLQEPAFCRLAASDRLSWRRRDAETLFSEDTFCSVGRVACFSDPDLNYDLCKVACSSTFTFYLHL